MKPNKPLENYENRVAQFEADERKTPAAALPAPFTVTQTGNIYSDARIAVLNKYKPEARAEIAQMERTGDTENSTYNKFICAMLRFVGDGPSHQLRTGSQDCGCFSCRK